MDMEGSEALMPFNVMTSDNDCNLIPSVGVLEASKMLYCWAGIELAPSVPWLVTLLTDPQSFPTVTSSAG